MQIKLLKQVDLIEFNVSDSLSSSSLPDGARINVFFTWSQRSFWLSILRFVRSPQTHAEWSAIWHDTLRPGLTPIDNIIKLDLCESFSHRLDKNKSHVSGKTGCQVRGKIISNRFYVEHYRSGM